MCFHLRHCKATCRAPHIPLPVTSGYHVPLDVKYRAVIRMAARYEHHGATFHDRIKTDVAAPNSGWFLTMSGLSKWLPALRGNRLSNLDGFIALSRKRLKLPLNVRGSRLHQV